MKLRNYQQKAIDDINHALTHHDKVLFQLSTGGGKTVIFCSLIQNRSPQKILILVNRRELVHQTSASLAKFGVTCEAITSKVKKLSHYSNVYVAMQQTIWNRLQKNPEFLPDIDLLIADECHWAGFDKFLPLYKKVVGFTATPVRLERFTYFKCDVCEEESDADINCHGQEMREFTREHKLSEHYQTIVLGPSISQLIEDGYLMPEQPYVVPMADLSNLKTKGGEYTEESINKAYTTEKALFNVVKNYKQYCQGRKTIVFSASTIQNEAVYNSFVVNGVQEVRMYDSVNTPNDDREDLVAWFRDTSEAVLCNVNVFTTGFDVTDVGAIIVNRPTQSLSLWIQMVGRGARPAFDKGKTDFIVIDGGENIARLNEWSSSIRNWESIFQNGFKPNRAKREVLEEVNTCPGCGEYMPKSALICDACGYEIQKKVKEKKVSEQLAVPIKLAEKPNWVKIIRYCKRINQGQIFALQLMTNQIVDLFRTHQVTKETYIAASNSGELRHKMMAIIRPVYGAIINTDFEDKPSKKNRTLEYQYQLVINAINKYYGIS